MTFTTNYSKEVFMLILVLNCGSSSAKFAVIDTQTEEGLASGIVENIGSNGFFKAKGHTQNKSKSIEAPTHSEAIFEIQQFLIQEQLIDRIEAVGHRVVHGGKYIQSKLISLDVIQYIESITQFAPLHQPAHVIGLQEAQKYFNKLPQVAVFDTAFHQTMPPKAYLYGLPYEIFEKHQIRRYGFHGTSHRYVSLEAARLLGKEKKDLNLLTAHLGNGSSATAILQGDCVDTTMGFTPLEGVLMGTRSGSLDPAILFYLNKTLGYDFDRLDTLLNIESGLLGLSGLSNDMRSITEAAQEGHERAQIALEVFCYKLARELGGIAMALPSIDALIFTGGIGENSVIVRQKVLQNLSLLGFKVDDFKNQEHGKNSNGIITQEQSTVAMVVPTNEELLIAIDTKNLVEKIS